MVCYVMNSACATQPKTERCVQIAGAVMNGPQVRPLAAGPHASSTPEMKRSDLLPRLIIDSPEMDMELVVINKNELTHQLLGWVRFSVPTTRIVLAGHLVNNGSPTYRRL